MISRYFIKRSVSAFIALFLVFLFPACWAGALTRAATTTAPSSSSTTNEEHQEREEHDEHDGDNALALGSRLVPRTAQRPGVVERRPLVGYRSRLLPDRQVPVRHPLQLSARRSI